MTAHPARAYDGNVGALVAELDARVASGMIKRRDHGDLALFHYSEECVWSNGWDEFTRMARGLIIDVVTQRIVATPFPKFFNYGERADAVLPDEPFTAFEKLDGSLGIAFFHAGEWHMATKGSFTSSQAIEGRKMLRTENLVPGTTYLFEIVGPWNRIIVPYAESALVLLGAYDEDGIEIEKPLAWALLSAVTGARLPVVHEGRSIADLVEIAKTLPRDDEGFVVRFASGYRVKIKGAAYVRAHKLASRVTPLAVWEAMLAGDDLVALRRELPEELWPDFDTILRILRWSEFDWMDTIQAAITQTRLMTPKEIGLDKSIRESVKWAVFAHRNNRDIMSDPKLRRAFHDKFRPTANALDGYSPSSSMHRFSEG